MTQCADPDESVCIEPSCSNGVCGDTRPDGVTCDDGIACTTTDTCDDGACAGQPKDSECDDGNWCSGVEACDPGASAADAGGCVPGTAPEAPADENLDDCMVPGPCNAVLESFPEVPAEEGASCDDSVECTLTDVCDTDGGCQGVPNDGVCDDEVFCNGEETCDAVDGCTAGEPVDPDDGDACTNDVCDPVQDAVVHTAVECDDGDFCNGPEGCDAATGCIAGEPPVAPEDETPLDCFVHGECDEETDDFPLVFALDGAACDDGVACTLTDVCDAEGMVVLIRRGDYDGEHYELIHPASGIRRRGWTTAPEHSPLGWVSGGGPDGAVAYTLTDGCDAEGGVAGEPTDVVCDDGLFCTGPELCDALDDCQEGEPPEVSDGIECTEDSCDEDLDVIVNAPMDPVCDDGAWCNGAETCDPTAPNALLSGCVPGACDDETDDFPPVVVDVDTVCDDGVDCTTGDACDAAGDCLAQPDDTLCDDDNPCTTDACDGAACLNLPNTNTCDDGLSCTLDDVCADAVCAGTPLDCDDENDCTVDACTEGIGCTYTNACTAECGCVTWCPPGADGVGCDDGDPETTGDFCLAGACGRRDGRARAASISPGSDPCCAGSRRRTCGRITIRSCWDGRRWTCGSETRFRARWRAGRGRSTAGWTSR